MNIAKCLRTPILKNICDNCFCKLIYRKYPNLVRTKVEIISDPNYLVPSSLKDNFKAHNLVRTSYFSRALEEEKVLELS